MKWRPRTRCRSRRRSGASTGRASASRRWCGAIRSRPPWRGLLLASAGVGAAIALLLVGRGVQRARPLTYVAQGADEQDGYIRGSADGQSQVQFSDGTHVALAEGARVSVLSRTPRGARLRVEEGEARFDVVHLPHAVWSVEAGPYVVYVTGTAFNLRWSGANEVIEVRMRAGSVQIGGPLLPERVTLRAGQHLTAKLASGELHIDEARVGGDGRAGAGASASASDNGAVRPAATQGSAAEAVENGAASQAPPAAVPAPPPLPPSPLVPVQPSAQPTLNDPAPAAPAPETAAAAPARSPAMMHRAAPRARPV